MINKKFYINISVRIFLIVANSLLIIPFISKDEKLFTILALSILLVLQSYLLIRYINRFNTEVANFFSALKTNDASFAFHDKAFPYISQEFRENIEYVKNEIFNLTEQKQIQQSYLKALIEHAQTGIISIREMGKIDIINKSALQILNMKGLENLKTLEKIHPGLFRFIHGAGIKDETKTILIKGESKAIPLSIRISKFKQKNDRYKLITFQDIESELNEKELLSWHKLIRVLTHEINNSISPITSLASSLEKTFSNHNETISPQELSQDSIQKTSEGLQLIAQRGEGLINFVNNYKSIASVKKIDFEQIKVAELFYNLELLLKHKLSEKNIQLKIEILPIDVEINADKKYIEQVCINIIKNAIEAVDEENGLIILRAYKDENDKKILEIIDNGKGINQEIKDQIFVPFFTTKEYGSGIGLSLAQQIMQLHGGHIDIESYENKKTICTLKFLN